MQYLLIAADLRLYSPKLIQYAVHLLHGREVNLIVTGKRTTGRLCSSTGFDLKTLQRQALHPALI